MIFPDVVIKMDGGEVSAIVMTRKSKVYVENTWNRMAVKGQHLVLCWGHFFNELLEFVDALYGPSVPSQ